MRAGRRPAVRQGGRAAGATSAGLPTGGVAAPYFFNPNAPAWSPGSATTSLAGDAASTGGHSGAMALDAISATAIAAAAGAAAGGASDAAPTPASTALQPLGELGLAVLQKLDSEVAPEDRRDYLGELLYRDITQLQVDESLAGRITGMLLELPESEILALLDDATLLQSKVDEANEIIEAYDASSAAGAEEAAEAAAGTA
jgi:polyadenylate-binding protein